MTKLVKLTKAQAEVLRTMSRMSPDRLVSWRIGHAMNRAGATAQTHMNALCDHDLIERTGEKDRDGAFFWRITPAGRAYLAEDRA